MCFGYLIKKMENENLERENAILKLNIETKEKKLNEAMSKNQLIIKKLEQFECRICFESVISTYFIACGHALCCAACASSLEQCPVCDSSSEYSHIYMM